MQVGTLSPEKATQVRKGEGYRPDKQYSTDPPVRSLIQDQQLSPIKN